MTMKNTIIFSLLGITSIGYAQKTDKYIKEKDITRIIRTLAADDMKGRSAAEGNSIFKAAAFIEKEFRSIGLQPLRGSTSFLQEFTKDKIVPTAEVMIDNKKIKTDHVILATEKLNINIKNGLLLKTISFDNTVQDKNQFFFEKAFGIARDTASCLVLVAPEFENSFTEFSSYFKSRFASGRKGVKVFVLGKTSATDYSIVATQKIEKIRMANVVGMLEGKTKKDEMVVFGGHYDHLGIQPKVDNDSIANGADDDASGTTAVIALARYFKKAKVNNRTLVFVAFTAEEIGGYGSRHFSQQLDAEKVVAMFNIEMIGKASKWGQNSAFITGFERSDFGQILQKNLAGTPFQFKPDPYPEQDLFYRSDNATLARLGVPAHTISTDQIDIDKLYHTVNDEVESLDMKNITSTIKAIALSSKTIVDGTDTPKRIDKTTVR
jgi:hypothetical protein